MRRKSPKRQPKLSSDSLLKTSKKGDIELTEQELGKVSGGTAKAQNAGSDTPAESVSLNFSKIEF
jgi:hypothetical protein